MGYVFNGIAEAADQTANWERSGPYTQTLLDRETLDVWTVTHTTENEWCHITDPAVVVVIGTNRRVSVQRMQKLCEEAMSSWEALKAAWEQAGCDGSGTSAKCYNCPHLNMCGNQ